MTPATKEKRTQLTQFIREVLAPFPELVGVVGIGSIGTGRCRPDSDIDAVVFLDPLDLYIVPAEAIWVPQTDTFHSIFAESETLAAEGIPLDFLRLDFQLWSKPDFVWPEARRAELSQGWLAYDRDGRLAELIAVRTAYGEAEQITRLDEAITWLDQHLNWDAPEQNWKALGPTIAHDRLHAAFQYLAAALFAYNRRWLPWRNRQMSALLALPWLPDHFDDWVLLANNAPSLDKVGYDRRVLALRTIFDDILRQVRQDGLYGDDPIGAAFIRSHEEPGRSWNMAMFNERRRKAK